MTTYATLSTLTLQFGERELIALTDHDRDGEIDQAVLDDALVTVDSIIDTYIGRRYPVPLADVPKILQSIAGHLFRYHLAGAEASETDPIRNRYKDAIKLLESIRDGLIHLGPDPAGDQPAQAKAIRVTGGNRRFTGDTLKDFG